MVFRAGAAVPAKGGRLPSPEPAVRHRAGMAGMRLTQSGFRLLGSVTNKKKQSVPTVEDLQAEEEKKRTAEEDAVRQMRGLG
jgi:hypothetical protein